MLVGFRKIHIFLLLLTIFIYYKTLQVNTLLNEVKNNNQLTERQKKILNKQCENAQKEIQTQIESEAEKLRKSIQREQITATADNTTEPQQDKI